jgi:hypothetical protein
MSKGRLNLTTKQVSLAATFAGIYAILNALPAFKILGGEGFINSSSFVEPIVGIILGPYIGGLSVLVGRVIANAFVPSSALGPFSPIPGVLTAFSSGMAVKGKWYVSAFVLYGLVVLFLAYPLNQVEPVFPYFIFLHAISGVLLILSSRISSLKLPFFKMKTSKLLFGLGLIFFPSTLIGQLSGTLVWEFLLAEGVTGVWKAFGMAIMLAFPVERALITVIACILGAALVKALKGLGIFMDQATVDVKGV